MPSFLYVEKSPASRPDLIFRRREAGVSVVIEHGEAYVPFRFVKEKIGPQRFLG